MTPREKAIFDAEGLLLAALQAIREKRFPAAARYARSAEYLLISVGAEEIRSPPL
jgi:hypothetical protein